MASQQESAIEQIRKGYPWKKVQAAQDAFNLKDADFARLIGVSDKTLSRSRKAQATLDPVASDRLYRAAKILKLAVSVFDDREKALHWLRRPQLALGDKVPLDLLDTEPGSAAVETLLGRIEYGVAA